jgi:hypothetical protein
VPGVIAAAKACANEAFAAPRDFASKKRRGDENPYFIGVSIRCENFHKKARWRGNFCAGVAAVLAARIAHDTARRRLHTKLSGVTVIFFLL